MSQATANPFISLEVHPHYGENAAVIQWSVDQKYDGGRFFVYRSYSGADRGGWKLLNPRDDDGNELPIYGDQFVDRYLQESKVGGRRHKAWYRVLLEHEGESHDSPVVAAFENLLPREFGIVRRILQLELERMDARRNGIPVLMLFPAVQTGPCPVCQDPDTGQDFNKTTCVSCFGTGYKGGYNEPVNTFMELYGASAHAIKDTPTGSADPTQRRARFLAWPRPWPNMTLVIQPGTDERFLVGPVQNLKFKGIIPIAVQTQLEALHRNNVAYKLLVKEPVPTS